MLKINWGRVFNVGVAILFCGCLKQSFIQAPIDLYVEGSSESKPVNQIPYDKISKDIKWEVLVIDRETHKVFFTSQLWGDSPIPLVDDELWECHINIEMPSKFIRMASVLCVQKIPSQGISTLYITRGVGCQLGSKDYYEKDTPELLITISCDGIGEIQ